MRQNRNNFLYSPELSAGLLGGSRAIFESGYGGNPAMGLVGFGEGINRMRQQRIANQFRAGQLGNALRGGATGALVDRVRQDPGFAQSLYDVQTGFRQGTRLTPEGRIETMVGAPQARGEIKYAERAGTNRADLGYKPEIVRRQEVIKAEIEPQKQKAINIAKVQAGREVGFAQADAALRQFNRQSQIVVDNIDKALNLVQDDGLVPATGFGSYLANVPNTDAGKLQGYLDTIKANIGFDKLQAMRDASPTGGALGQVSEFENRLLQAVQGALDPRQEDLLVENLRNIKELYPKVMAERNAAFNADYRNVRTNPTPTQSTTIEFLGFE